MKTKIQRRIPLIYILNMMFFGLTNSPATFQMMMDDIFEDLITEGMVVVYLDDILIFTKILEEHHDIVYKVLDLLQLHNLSLKPALYIESHI